MRKDVEKINEMIQMQKALDEEFLKNAKIAPERLGK